MNSLKVRCQHHEVGCQWVGELRYLQEHLDPVIRKCGFIFLDCPLGCGKNVRNSAMKDHTLSDCSKRFYVCEHCGYNNKFDIVTEQHYPLCEMFPVKCPNACSGVSLKRLELVSHLEQCPLQVIQCPFTSAGCTVQLPRREMEEHKDKAMEEHKDKAMCQHLRMSMLQLKSKQETPALNADRSHNLINLPPVQFTIVDFAKKMESEAEWTSPSFYSHPQGYKLCLVVYPNGILYEKGTNMSVLVGLLNGEHDDSLSWPLDADIVVELLNWRDDKGHHKETVAYYSSQTYQIIPGGIKMPPIYSQFIPHSSLSCDSTTNTEYLQNDCVRLRVSKVILYSNALLNKTPSWQNHHNGYQSLYEFTLTDFSKRKQFSNTHCSSSFYTHHDGYKFCLLVDASDIDSGDNIHVSVYLKLMAGEFDEKLEWPFVGSIHVELLNWRQDKGHYKKTVHFAAAFRLVKVSEAVMYGQGKGYHQFIAHSSLAYDPTSNTEYLQEDCLRFRVST